ncbi:hypothetical protein [Virgibacillus kimchii]
MVISSRIISIGIIIASLAIGLISFYLLSDLPKEEKKQRMEELMSQLINFILFVWLGKILLNIPLFIQDPLAVLAYPGNAGAFYLAVLFTAIIIIYKWIRNKLDLMAFAEMFAHVFLVSSFVYEFLQLSLYDNTYALGYLIVLAVLLIGFFSLRGRVSIFIILLATLAVWTAGMLLLQFIYPFVTVFEYMMEPWFIGLFVIFCVSIMIVNERKRKS